MALKTRIFTHHPVSHSLALCWWRHNRLAMTSQWPDTCDANTWQVINKWLDIDFIHGTIHGRSCKKIYLPLRFQRNRGRWREIIIDQTYPPSKLSVFFSSRIMRRGTEYTDLITEEVILMHRCPIPAALQPTQPWRGGVYGYFLLAPINLSYRGRNYLLLCVNFCPFHHYTLLYNTCENFWGDHIIVIWMMIPVKIILGCFEGRSYWQLRVPWLILSSFFISVYTAIWCQLDNLSNTTVSSLLISPKRRIYASVSIGSGNGLSPVRWQAFTRTNADLLSIRPLVTNFSQIQIEIKNFSLMKMHLKMSSAKWQPFCPGGRWVNINTSIIISFCTLE